MSKRDLPTAFYAAAGAGDLAYQRLRKVPEATERALRVAGETATTLRERVTAGETRLPRERIATEVARLRESAQRSAATAQQKAVTGYRHLVAHGEKVVAAREGATTVTVGPAEIDSPPDEDTGTDTATATSQDGASTRSGPTAGGS